MPNVSPSSRRTPGRVPRRGLLALTLTATALALLFSFKTPSDLFADTSDEFELGLSGALTADAVLPSMPPATEPPQREPAVVVPPPTETPTAEPPTPTATPTAVPSAEPAAPQVASGQTVSTPFGPVQVEVTVGTDGINDVRALQLPHHRAYSARISKIVEPMLRDEALQAQSASINLISGATYTSKGYAMSLQSALDHAAATTNVPA